MNESEKVYLQKDFSLKSKKELETIKEKSQVEKVYLLAKKEGYWQGFEMGWGSLGMVWILKEVLSLVLH